MPIELLAPAGSPEALDSAIGEGADSVYLGLKSFNARLRSTNFTYSRFETAVYALRRMGKKLYVTVNTVFEQREADRVYQLLKYLASVGPDALIVQDFGVLAMARSEFPGLKIHASTQMNIASSKGANALSKYGVSRVVLARELSLEELRKLRAETNMELEVFVHGALCVSASGLCLFSSYLGGKSANRGMCTQACRRLYNYGEDGASSGNGYFFSPADLQLLESLPELVATGINSLKIEGRMKSADYVGTVVSAYRLVLDAIAEGAATGNEEKIHDSIVKGREILSGDFARSKTMFYFKTGNDEKQINWLNPVQDGGTGISLGVIQKVQGKDNERLGLVSIRNDSGVVPAIGDSIRLHRSDDSKRVSHKLQYATPFDGVEATGAYWLSIPEGFDRGDHVYLIQTKAMSKRYRPLTSGNTRPGGRAPGFDKAPIPTIIAKRKDCCFPEGLYVAVSQINDLYIVQSSRPKRVMLSLTQKTIKQLLRENIKLGTKTPLPFKPDQIILTFDPYFPQSDAESLDHAVHNLVELGYRQFVLNNLGHFSLFRDIRPEVQLIAGPWLYIFNSWALSFLASQEPEGFVSPLENNRQNLERTLQAAHKYLRSMVFIPVFAWPPLFRIREDLGQLYDFTLFSDNTGEKFSLVCDSEKTLVIPQKPFSIIDKIPFLQEAGFRRFIIDLSGPSLKKTDYKDLMHAVNNSSPLPRVSRFNWKNGFYSEERGSGIGD